VQVDGRVPPPPTDEQVFDAAYREHFAPLMRVAFLMTGSNETAEDVVQDVFVRCRSRLADLEDARSYLRAAVINECRSVHRRARRAPELAVPVPDEIPTELLDLRDALATLPWKQRAAIVLRYFVDTPDEQIAESLGCRPSTVRSLIRRGIANLRKVLA
jgi:RNA polymerase sigma factor (sigma-70 family)